MAVIAIEHVSLDGVMQAPARADEDTRNGFSHGGWAEDGSDPSQAEAMSARMGTGFSWLFGRRTYDDLLGHWNGVGGPMADGLNSATKYVASSHPDAELPWPNSRLIAGDVPAEVRRLRAEAAGNLVIMGSGRLVHTLRPLGLIEEFLLFVHPIVLGSGLRVFDDGGDGNGARDAQRYELIESSASDSGVITAAYRLAD